METSAPPASEVLEQEVALHHGRLLILLILLLLRLRRLHAQKRSELWR